MLTYIAIGLAVLVGGFYLGSVIGKAIESPDDDELSMVSSDHPD